MTPFQSRRPRSVTRRVSLGGLLLALLVVLAGCARGSAASFDPQGPCFADGQQAGAYPDLEALIPKLLDGKAPSRLDSGRNCTPGSLGTLVTDGIGEVRFAGGLWETGARSGVSIAIFEAQGLTTPRLAEFYEAGARSAPKTENITTGPYAVGSIEGRRLDTLNDESFQTIVVFDGPKADTVRAVLVGSDVRETGTRQAHEALVERATAAAAGS